MKKLICVLIMAVMIFCNVAHAKEIKFDIPDDKLPRIVNAMKGLYPIPTDEEGNSLCTDNEWAREALRRFVIQTVRRWEAKKAMDAARDAVLADNELLN